MTVSTQVGSVLLLPASPDIVYLTSEEYALFSVNRERLPVHCHQYGPTPGGTGAVGWGGGEVGVEWGEGADSAWLPGLALSEVG